MKLMTRNQLELACKPFRYVILELKSGEKIAANSGCAQIVKKRASYRPDAETKIVNVEPCGFHEYISKKRPFIESTTIRCHKCGGTCKSGQAIINQSTGSSEWPDGDMTGATLLKSGKPILSDCMKCENCGHSFLPAD